MAAPLPTQPRSRGARLTPYAVACALPLAVSLVLSPMQAGLADSSAAMLLLLSVLGPAAAFGIGPGVACALVAAVGYNLVFLEPRFTLHIAHPLDLVSFGVFLVVALATGGLAGRVRDNERRLAETTRTTAALLEASRALSRAGAVDEAAQALVQQLAAAGVGGAIVLVRGDEGLRLAAAPAGVSALADETWVAARAALDADDDAPPGEWRFLPLEGAQRRIGVVGLRAADRAPGTELAGPLVDQGGVVIERALLAAAAAENQALRQADRLRAGVLNSISHDFRTPLASILGSATTLSDYEATLSPSVRRDLLASIQQDARRLNAFIGALLDMARLEGGALKPTAEWVDVRETLGSALRRLKPQLAGRRIQREFPASLSLVRADPILLEQTVLNLLDNAARLTRPGGTIRVAAEEDARGVLVVIEDEGPGIPPAALETVFDRFRRLKLDDRGGGLGLGLSIAKGFVEAMGGRIAAVSPLTETGGARFVVSLPKTTETPRGLL